MVQQAQREELSVEGKRALNRDATDDPDRGLDDISWGPILGGSAALLVGLTRSGFARLLLMGAGAAVVYQGLQNNDLLGKNLDVKRMLLHTRATTGVEVQSSVTVDRPIGEVFQFWRNLANLPRFLDHIEEVRPLDPKRSHWTARLPRGVKLQWESQIIEEIENELLVWKSVQDSDVYNEGYITFQPAFGNNGSKKGTEVHARIIYRPPAGAIGAKVADFLKAIPRQVIKEDLRSFKQLIEAGERPTITGQPSGRPEGQGRTTLDRLI